MTEYNYDFSSPDLGFVPAPARLCHNRNIRFYIFGQGSLGKSLRTALSQAEFSVVRGYDNDRWEARNMVNTLGLEHGRLGQNKGFRADIRSTLLFAGTHLRNTSRTSQNQPVFILSTDDLVSRAAVMHQAIQHGAFVIDMRSSPEMTRTIFIDGRRADEWRSDPQALGLFDYLYPAIQPNAANQFEFVDPSLENTGQEGGCMMRGSIMHSLTCITRAMQFIFRIFQPNYNRAFEIIEDHPWTGVSTHQAFGENRPRQELTNHAPSYREFNPRDHRESYLVTKTERPPWTGDLPYRSNEIAGLASAANQLFYEWRDTSSADTIGSAEATTSN